MNFTENILKNKTHTFFIDLDGTIIHSKNEEAIPGAIEQVNKWFDEGHKIIITTRRGNEWYDNLNSRYSEQSTIRLLKVLGLKYHYIMFNIDSPRVVINDKGAYSINVDENEEWTSETFRQKIENSLPEME